MSDSEGQSNTSAVPSGARAYWNIVKETFTHSDHVIVIDRATGKVVARIPKNQTINLDREYAPEQYIVVG